MKNEWNDQAFVPVNPETKQVDWDLMVFDWEDRYEHVGNGFIWYKVSLTIMEPVK